MAPKEAIKDDELAELSEEERAALADDDDEGNPDEDAEKAALAAAEAEAADKAAAEKADAEKAGKSETEGDDPPDPNKPIDDKDKVGDDDAAKTVIVDGEAGDTTSSIVAEEFQPQYQADAVENYDEKIEALVTKKAEIKQQYDDGDISVTELIAANDEVSAETRELEKQQDKFEMSQEQAKQSGEQRWQWEQDRFFNLEANSAYKENPIMGAAIDTAIKTLAADEENEGKPMSWFLEEADRQVQSLFKPGATLPTSPDDKGEVDGKKPKAPIPPNLGDLPAAEVLDTGGDEFSKLDKLGGIELEQALAKMTPAEQDRYLKG